MPQTSYALVTAVGHAMQAAAIAGGPPVVLTHIAIGDGATVPSGGETELYNELERKAIAGSGVVVGAANTAWFDYFLAADDGPYAIRELGLFAAGGELVAIARADPQINKPLPSAGQTVAGMLRMQVVFTDLAHITVVVDPALKVPLQRLSVLPWVPAIAMEVTEPPAEPAPGDTYLVGEGAGGAWTGQEGKLAEFTPAGWALIEPPDGHGVGLPDGSAFVREDGLYRPLGWIASDLTLTIGPEPDDDFATIPAAMEWLRHRLIAEDATVTLALAAGQHVYDGPGETIVVDHPMGQRIHLVGTPMLGADPDKDDFAVTGNNGTARGNDAVTNLAMLRGRYATEIRCINGAFLHMTARGAGFLDNILVTGDGSDVFGVMGQDWSARLGTVSVHGFGDDNLVLFGGSLRVSGVLTSSGGLADAIELSDCYTSIPTAHMLCYGCAVGFELNRNVSVYAHSIYSSGHAVDAIWLDEMSAIHLLGEAVGANCGQSGLRMNNKSVFRTALPSSATFNNNGGSGVIIGGLSYVLAIGLRSNGNGGAGMILGDGSAAYIINGQSNSNAAAGITASRGSAVAADGHTSTGNGSVNYSPAVNTVGNHNSYIAKA